MEVPLHPLLCLLTCISCVTHGESKQRFFIAAPSVFHVGVKEAIWIQVGEDLLGQPVSCQLETEMRVPMSPRERTTVTTKGQFVKVNLEISGNLESNVKTSSREPPYLLLACEVGGQRKLTRVLVSRHRGYIFIQTNQPLYNPTEKVHYRIFTMDHSMRPKTENVHVSVFNADGNKIIKSTLFVENGTLTRSFNIPDISRPGVWKITAHYQGDENNPSTREFKVQQYVLPSFDVSVKPERSFLLVTADTFNFTIHAAYTYGKAINGAFHCRFGIKQSEAESNDGDLKFIKGLEQTGSVKSGLAEISVKIPEINQKLKSSTVDELAAIQSQFYIGVTVTDILSGEVQESEVFYPIVLSKYIVDLSRTRFYYTPTYPFDVVVMVRHPNGSPADRVQVQIEVSSSEENAKQTFNLTTNTEGAGFISVNLEGTPPFILVEAMADGVKQSKKVQPMKSLKNSFIHLSVTKKILSPNNYLDVTFYTNASPEDGYIYYMILSRGSLRTANSVLTQSSSEIKIRIQISPEMVPFFRLIGFFYDSEGNIIADSIWVDVEDTCEEKLHIKLSGYERYYSPESTVELEIDAGNQVDSKIALLVVDKAAYALNADNKLTPNQVFNSMKSYDLGCSFGGGENAAAVLNDAGLAFISHSNSVRSMRRKGYNCESGFRRNKRTLDIQTEMARKEAAFKEAEMQKCCRHGFALNLMRFTCEQRAKKARRTNTKECVEVFRECCEFATALRDKKKKEDKSKGYGRTAFSSVDEEFFDNEIHNIRRYFPPSFEFKDISVTGKTKHTFHVPDSITTWEVQALSISPSHGFCVAEPVDLVVFKPLFVSLRLPYSVKLFEQLSIDAVIFNYGKMEMEVLVHMKQVDGLCSPGPESSSSHIRINLQPESSQIASFSAVPMETGEIPIIIHLYEVEDGKKSTLVDAIQKQLLVKNEGVEMREELAHSVSVKGKSELVFIDGVLPNNTVPGTEVNIFVKLEAEHFGQSTAVPLLSPSKVENLIRAPYGCGEQTMILMSPTALSVQYLDKSNRWLELPVGLRDTALDFIEKAYVKILTFRKSDGSFSAWTQSPTSTWLTALVVKILSLVAERQVKTRQLNGTTEQHISQEDIRKAVKYLTEIQNSDGSFSDANPVYHREMQGGIGGVEQDASLTAFITIALHRSRPFLDAETSAVEKSISRATGFLLQQVIDLKRPYSLAITTYCLASCLTDQTLALKAWAKLKALSKQEGNCQMWEDEESFRLVDEAKSSRVPSKTALTVETTAYVLLTALALKDSQAAHAAACFLSSQENYEGGFKSTQDTIVALEALSEYALSNPQEPNFQIDAQFTVSGRTEKEMLALDSNAKKVETDLKRLMGNQIQASISGNGKVKMKVAKVYYTLKKDSNCADVSINVTVVGTVEYTDQATEDYSYFEDYVQDDERMEDGEDLPQSAIDWFDARNRRKRGTTQTTQTGVVYTVCVSHDLRRNLSGMAIADVTLLSGFDAVTEDLHKLKNLADQYISHYETTRGRVILYFNEIEEGKACIAFGAEQSVSIGLLQQAPATFYDYYEPDRRCSVLYSAPAGKMISLLCSDDVCQCAEKKCFTERKTFEKKIRKNDRIQFACYNFIIDYAYDVVVDSVTEENNFVMYSTTVTDALRHRKDTDVSPGSIRVFAKRKHCKEHLKVKETYFIMGNDGSTKDSSGNMQYLLDSNTWVEKKPKNSTCKASINKLYCKEFKEFIRDYQLDGCNL